MTFDQDRGFFSLRILGIFPPGLGPLSLLSILGEQSTQGVPLQGLDLRFRSHCSEDSLDVVSVGVDTSL